MKKQQLGFILMALSAVGLAVGTILMKLVPQNTTMTPAHVAVWRFSIAAPLMWLMTVIRQPKSGFIPDRPWWLIGLGVIYSLASLFALLALERLSSSLYVIIVYIYPSLVVIYSLIIGKSVPRLWWLGLPITLIGLVLTVFEFGQSLQVDLVGFLISVLNGFAIAAYMILSEKIFKFVRERQLGTTWVNTGAMLAGFLLIPFMGVSSPESLGGWILLISLGIFGTLIPILALNSGVQMVGAARGSVIVTLQPVVAVLISTIFLGDILTLQQWAGGALVIIAIVLLQRSPDRNTKKSDL